MIFKELIYNRGNDHHHHHHHHHHHYHHCHHHYYYHHPCHLHLHHLHLHRLHLHHYFKSCSLSFIYYAWPQYYYYLGDAIFGYNSSHENPISKDWILIFIMINAEVDEQDKKIWIFVKIDFKVSIKGKYKLMINII